ncbi:hypothetical protein LSUB1_G000526 [Lachnellula subtilissima]|uniref:EthD domain-containing protein n=1 Tax=Lachnellula subtilissima TaxID=602034 RepID=A0A8H8UFY0_9HELO|nr:hypothetical protein LSUB1_G000526 [Lachnellula subtilissima]
MTYTIVAYLARKPSMTPAEFRNYYENTHMPLLISLTGPVFPKTHKRYYLPRTPKDPASPDTTNANHAVRIYEGTAEDFDYDAYAELEFESIEKFAAFGQRLAEVAAAEDGAFHADELAFLDLSKRRCVTVDGPVITVAPSDI